MNLRVLDQELSTLSREIESFSKRVLSSCQQKYGRVAAEHQAQRALEAQLTARIRLLEGNAQRAPLLPKRDAAVLLWTSRLADRLKSYLNVASSAFSKVTWLRILQQRASAGGGRGGQRVMDIQEEQMLAVFSRRKELEEAKAYLQAGIVRQQDEEHGLKARYQFIAVGKENRSASGSLQLRLGEDLDDAMNSPIMVAIRDMVNGSVVPIMMPKQFAAMLESLERYQDIAYQYLEASRQDALDSLDFGLIGPPPTEEGKAGTDGKKNIVPAPPGSRSRRRSRQDIHGSLTQRKNEYLERQKVLAEPQFPIARPKLVQSPVKQASS